MSYDIREHLFPDIRPLFEQDTAMQLEQNCELGENWDLHLRQSRLIFLYVSATETSTCLSRTDPRSQIQIFKAGRRNTG